MIIPVDTRKYDTKPTNIKIELPYTLDSQPINIQLNNCLTKENPQKINIPLLYSWPQLVAHYPLSFVYLTTVGKKTNSYPCLK